MAKQATEYISQPSPSPGRYTPFASISYSKMKNKDLQVLVDHCYGMARTLLMNQKGEFYPFGAYVNNNAELTPVTLYEGDEFPLSQKVIDSLKQHFTDLEKNGKINSYAISYNYLAKKDTASEKTNAVAIAYYSLKNNYSATYYYPYHYSELSGLLFGEPWGIVA